MKETRRNIRFGVICDGSQLHAWQEIVITRLISKVDIELELVIFERNSSNKKPLVSSLRNSSHGSGILWNLYYRKSVIKKSKALQMVETSFLFDEVLKIQCDFITGKEGFVKLEDVDVEKIENARLDFILDFSSMTFAGKVLKATRYGIWSYHFGDPEKFIGSPPCFWEIYFQDVLTSAYLTRSTDEPVTKILLNEGHLKTDIS